MLSQLSPKLSDYTYELPDGRIAKFPLKQRGLSKLLVYRKGLIEHSKFDEIVEQLPSGCSLFFNNTKVILARIFFYKETGAKIEIFLLHPVSTPTITQAMEASDKVSWQCMIGNAKKWKNNEILHKTLSINNLNTSISIKRLNINDNIVEFKWECEKAHQILFCDIVEAIGKVPLPPYLNREPTENDKPRYQTVYSKNNGAVAAPTAGLHFTNDILMGLEQKKIVANFLTLHVSAGTFQPIKVENVMEHSMHKEQVIITKENLQNLIASETIIAVGTTSMRTLESLYWYGVKLLKGLDQTFHIDKLFPYDFDDAKLPNRLVVFNAILKHMESNNLSELNGNTEIFIFPGYTFKVTDGLITNYHQPGSTLILLVAAFVGEDWRKIYKQALENDYRFLSYGDSSLLLP